MAEGRHRAVAGHERRFIAHWPEPFCDGADQLQLVAMRKVPATHRTAEQNVADKGKFRLGVMKNDVARRVARTMANLKKKFANSDLIAIDKPACRLEGLAEDAIFGAVGGQPVDPVTISFMRTLDRDAEVTGKDSGTSAMVDMAVGEEDLFNCNASRSGCVLETIKVSAWIDERAQHRSGAPEQSAILLERRNRNNGRSKRRITHLDASGASLAIAGGSSFIDAATASACRMTLRILPPASLERFWSDQPRLISSANSKG